MRTLRLAAVVLAATLASPSAIAQPTVVNQTGQATETQERQAAGDTDLIWNLVGLLGLLGLLGLHTQHDEDSYHPAPIE